MSAPVGSFNVSFFYGESSDDQNYYSAAMVNKTNLVNWDTLIMNEDSFSNRLYTEIVSAINLTC